VNQQELNEVIKSHGAWLRGESGGKRANLQGANLQGADLQRANLQRANLQRANLQRADLQDANLQRANLQRADLQRADLQRAYLQRAYLQRANLQDANLQRAYLQRAYLQRANLQDANLQRANLQDANLQRANLQRANLQDANLQRANLPHFSICPEVGGFTAWKKVADGIVLEVEIPADAKRTSSLVGRKCRASYIIPRAAYRVSNGELIPVTDKKKFGGWRNDGEFIYTLNRKRKADKFDDDIRVECTNGIHFFMTAREAMEW